MGRWHREGGNEYSSVKHIRFSVFCRMHRTNWRDDRLPPLSVTSTMSMTCTINLQLVMYFNALASFLVLTDARPYRRDVELW